MEMLKAIGYGIALFYITWLFFLAIMALKLAKDTGKLRKPVIILGSPILLFGILLDFSTNMVATFVFLELPQETMLTYRCERHLRDSDGWDYRVALWICRNLLDPFQQGGHCH